MVLRDAGATLILWTRIDGPEGSIRLPMLLDTGTTYVTLPSSAARDLGYYEACPRKTVSTTTASGIVRAPLFSLTAVEALGMEARDVTAIGLDLPRQATFSGLLGMSFLRNFDIDLHLKSGALRFR